MVSDSDLNLLEAYLDDALSSSQVHDLDARLAEEPDIAAALDALRSERQTRVAVFASLTPEPEDAERFASGVLASVRRRRAGRWVIVGARWLGGLAACLVVGFFVGWISRGRAGAPSGQIAGPPENRDDSHLVIHVPRDSGLGQYHVAVVDAGGHVISVEHFSKLEDAAQFAAYIGQYHAHRQQIQPNSAAMGTSPGPGIPTLDSKRSPRGTSTSKPTTQPAN